MLGTIGRDLLSRPRLSWSAAGAAAPRGRTAAASAGSSRRRWRSSFGCARGPGPGSPSTSHKVAVRGHLHSRRSSMSRGGLARSSFSDADSRCSICGCPSVGQLVGVGVSGKADLSGHRLYRTMDVSFGDWMPALFLCRRKHFNPLQLRHSARYSLCAGNILCWKHTPAKQRASWRRILARSLPTGRAAGHKSRTCRRNDRAVLP